MVVRSSSEQNRSKSDNRAADNAAADCLENYSGDFERHDLPARDHGDNDAEGDRRRTVVEKAFRLDKQRQPALRLRFLESRDDGNRVSG